jgi:hypothetical protein
MNTITRLEIITKYVSEIGMIIFGGLIIFLPDILFLPCPPFCEPGWVWPWEPIIGIAVALPGFVGLVINLVLAPNQRNLMNQ